jgi:hypothetical protein
MSSVSMSMWTRLSCSTRWISTIGLSAGLQHAGIAAAHWMRAVRGAAQGFRPETRRLVQIGNLAVDQHGAKARVAHVGSPDSEATQPFSIE